MNNFKSGSYEILWYTALNFNINEFYLKFKHSKVSLDI